MKDFPSEISSSHQTFARVCAPWESLRTLGNSLWQIFPDNHCGLSTVYTTAMVRDCGKLLYLTAIGGNRNIQSSPASSPPATLLLVALVLLLVLWLTADALTTFTTDTAGECWVATVVVPSYYLLLVQPLSNSVLSSISPSLHIILHVAFYVAFYVILRTVSQSSLMLSAMSYSMWSCLCCILCHLPFHIPHCLPYIYPWKSLLDRIGPVGQFGEKKKKKHFDNLMY